MKIVVMGPKGAGKSTVGLALANMLGLQAVETDTLTEDLYEAKAGRRQRCREIYSERGEAHFRALEREAALQAADLDWCVILTGGSLMLDPDVRRVMRRNAILVYLTASAEALWPRATAAGTPPWLSGPDGPELFAKQVAYRDEVLRPFADIVLDAASAAPDVLAEQAADLIGQELILRSREGSTFGDVIRVSTFGESHGAAIGAVLDGLKPGIEISEEVIQEQLDRRRPGQSKIVTRRNEADQVHILSGVFEGKSTGAPIALVIYNQDQRSADYDNIKDAFRPGHADFTFYKKYGLRDHRGGGRSSGRETACRVAAGAVARDILRQRGVTIVAHAIEIGGIRAEACDYAAIDDNPVRCADPEAAKAMEEAILAARKNLDSVGGVIQLEITGLPPGLGDPVFGKLSARLAGALMSIGTVKGMEIGDGFALTRMHGSESNDSMGNGTFRTNHCGGILGGMSTGQPVRVRLAIKPTSSIGQEQHTIDIHGEDRAIRVHGRHDPCIVPRAVPVVESMAALVVLDAWEIQSRIRPGWEQV